MLARIYAINHKPGSGIFGGIHREFVMGRDDRGSDLGDNHVDMRAPYYIWKERRVPAIVGFHGYRKHIDFVTPGVGGGSIAKGWHEVSLAHFHTYQHMLAGNSAIEDRIREALTKYDVLTVEPFDCSYNVNMAEDYRRSRSTEDWEALAGALAHRGLREVGETTPFIRPMHFVCADQVFCRFMEFWDSIRREIEPKIKSADTKDPGYPPRALGYLSERIFSLWLDNSHWRVKTFPLLICWSAS